METVADYLDRTIPKGPRCWKKSEAGREWCLYHDVIDGFCHLMEEKITNGKKKCPHNLEK